MKLVSLDAMKAHLQMDHNEDDEDIERKITQASHLVLDNLDKGDDLYADPLTGLIPEDSDGEPNVPHSVRAATTLLVEMLYNGTITEKDLEHGYLPFAVMNLLYSRRMPSMA